MVLDVPGYILVHAGLRPGVPLSAQTEQDLLWVREMFLESDHDFGARVVHGHTIAPHPQVRPNRIGIDTGAFASGVLSAVRLSPDQPPAILQVRD